MTGRSRGKGLAQAVPAVMVLVLAASVVLLLQANREGYFYYDSWSYLELSKTVFHDFYRFSAWRSYASTSPYSAAFPPLWPTLIALWNALFGSGIHAGVWLAALAWAGLAVAAEWAGRRLFALPWLGLASAALTLFDIRLVNEVVAGKTIPLQLALMALALGLLRFDGVLTARRAAALGLVMGLALMNRFDALLPAAVVGMGLLVASRRPPAVLAYGAVLLVTVSPWIAYSLLRHHTLFVSDNRLVALTAENIQVADWFATPPATVFTDPARYAGKIAHNLVWFFQDMQLTPKIDMLIVALAAGLVAWRRWGRGRGEGAVPLLPRASLVAVLIIGLAIAAQCALYVATGYIDGRYFAVHRWFLVFVGLGILMPPLTERWRPATVALLSACTLLGVVGLYRHNPYIVPGETTQAVAEAERVYRCVGQAPGQTILFDHWGQQLAALKGTMVAGLPNNFASLTAAERAQFIRAFRITHFHGADPAAVLGPAVSARLVANCPGVPLWRIVP